MLRIYKEEELSLSTYCQRRELPAADFLKYLKLLFFSMLRNSVVSIWSKPTFNKGKKMAFFVLKPDFKSGFFKFKSEFPIN